MAEEDGRGGGASAERLPIPHKPPKQFVQYLRECLLLLAIQVVTVTYVAGLNPPGGVWSESKDGHLAGDPILALTNHVRYNAFSCSNTTALMASGAVVLLLLFVRGETISNVPWFNTVLRIVMSLAMLALAVAYATGASRHKFTTRYAAASVAILFVCLVIFISIWIFSKESKDSKQQDSSLNLSAGRAMFSAIFVISMAYTAGLSPPGAFWLDNEEGHLAGDPALPVYHLRRYTAFFVGNTAAFIGSLFIIPLVLTNRVGEGFMFCWLYECFSVAGSGLLIAYAAGSCIDKAYIAYVVLGFSIIVPLMVLIVAILLCIWMLIRMVVKDLWHNRVIRSSPTSSSRDGMNPFFILLFTTISAAATYQGGLSPPGGLWLNDLDSHKAGGPILFAKHPTRYRVFMFCNSMALVASIVSIFMALTSRCQTQRSRALDGLMLLDLIGLVGAYAAGCCRDVQTSIHVISLGGAIIVYVVFHMAFLMPRDQDQLDRFIKEDKKVELDRDLMLGILGAALTYQTGLTPPGGFWQSDDEFGHTAGEPVLLSTNPSRYKVFFYLNALCFMASIFLTILFVNPLLYRAGIQCRALFVCVLAVLFGLMGGYVAGSYRNLEASIYIIVLGAAMFIFIISILYLLYKYPEPSNTNNQRSGHEQEQVHVDSMEDRENTSNQTSGEQAEQNTSIQTSGEQAEEKLQPVVQEDSTEDRTNTSNQTSVEQPVQQVPPAVQGESKEEKQKKAVSYLVLIGSIGATVTYQAGFAPPRGFWPDNSGHAVGNPALRDMDAHRYRMFFFFNTTCFAASEFLMYCAPIFLVIWGSMDEMVDEETVDEEIFQKSVYTFIQAPTAVYAIGILGAYAAGSSSGWDNTTIYAVALVAPVLFCIFLIDPIVILFGKLAERLKVFHE